MPQVRLSPRASALRAALYTYLRPRLAADAQMNLTPILLSFRRDRSFKPQHDTIAAAVRQTVKDKLAQDADIDDVANFLDSIGDLVDSNNVDVPEALNDDPNLELRDVDDDGREDLVRDDEPDPLIAKVREFLKKIGVSDEVMSQFDQLVSSEDEPEDLEPNDEYEEDDDMSRDRRMAGDRHPRHAPAMDTAAVEQMILRRVEEARINERANARAIEAAREEVRGTVGQIALACDSAEDVYAAALGALGRSVKGIDSSAYRAMFEIARDAQFAARRNEPRRLAADAVPVGTPSFAERFPSAARVRVGG
jgi:hypothetical protein